MYLALFLVAINLFKLLTARSFPLIGDEAYYWLWSKHLDLSYVDHPPMIAYFNFILTSFFGDSEFAVRIGAILIVLLVSGIIYLTAKELYDKKAAAAAVIIFNLLPTFFGGGMFLVPQTVLFLFYSLSFYLLVRLRKTRNAIYWYPLGIAAGFGLLSDYVMGLFVIGTFLLLVLDKDQRFWFAHKEPYIAAVIAFIIFLPVVIWNLRLGFTPFFYWGGKMGVTPRVGDNLLNFFGLQMVLYTPVIFIMTFYNLLRAKDLLMRIFSGIVFVPFLLISPIMNVGGHWTSTSYLPAILDSQRAKKFSIGILLFFALLVNILGFAYYLFLYPVPAELKGKEFTINRQLPGYLKEISPASGKTYYFANDLGMLGLVAFHGKVATNMAPGRLRQVDLWGQPKLAPGDNIIYFALNETPLFKKLQPLFNKVQIEPRKRIFNKDANLSNLTQIFICRGFKRGVIP